MQELFNILDVLKAKNPEDYLLKIWLFNMEERLMDLCTAYLQLGRWSQGIPNGYTNFVGCLIIPVLKRVIARSPYGMTDKTLQSMKQLSADLLADEKTIGLGGSLKRILDRYERGIRQIESEKTNEPSVISRTELETALRESLRLQSNYGKLLNMHDGGERITFDSVTEWVERLREVGTIQKQTQDGGQTDESE